MPGQDETAFPAPVGGVLTRGIVRQHRSIELQSFRGIAALTVLLWHCSQYFQQTSTNGTIFDLVFNASSAVISFFVLSGFVLALSQLNRPTTIAEAGVFYIRRAFRIYPALWLAIVFALVYQAAIWHKPLEPPVAHGWAGMVGRVTLDPRLLIQTVIGKTTELALPVWTLFIELVGSLIMPIIIVVLIRRPAMLVPIFFAFLAVGLVPRLNRDGLPIFMLCFLYGAMAVLAVGPIRRRLDGDWPARLLAIGGIMVLWFGRALMGPYGDVGYGPASILVGGAGAAVAVAAIYARPEAFRPLAHPRVAWLGEISYSLYLLHMPILGLLALGIARLYGAALAANVLPATLLLMVTTVSVCWLAASASYLYIELPAIRVGKTVIAAVKSRMPIRST